MNIAIFAALVAIENAVTELNNIGIDMKDIINNLKQQQVNIAAKFIDVNNAPNDNLTEMEFEKLLKDKQLVEIYEDCEYYNFPNRIWVINDVWARLGCSLTDAVKIVDKRLNNNGYYRDGQQSKYNR